MVMVKEAQAKYLTKVKEEQTSLVKDSCPDGYKLTEVGEIPLDWNVSAFSEICNVNQGLQIATENRKKHPTNKSKIYITIQYLSSDDAAEYIDDYTSSVCCQEKDILMTRTGNTGIVVTGVEGVFHNNFFKINFDRRKINSEYFVYYLRSHHCQKTILEKAGTSTIPDLNHGDFYTIKMAFPSFEKQTAIVKALSDVDALITSLEKLITKKQAIKTATMQQLLTGKKRLPGFGEGKGYKQTELGEIPEDWEVVTLGAVAKINMGQSPSSSNYNDKGVGTPLVQGNADILNRQTIIRNYTSQITKMAHQDDLILSVRAPVGEVAKATFDCCIGRGVCAIRYKNDYLYHWLVYFEKEWSKFSKGSTFDSINSDELKNIQLLLPIDKEQTAIATVLSDMDKDIKCQVSLRCTMIF